MLAAVSGLAYALASTMHLEGYLGYFLPLPVILSALRSGPAAGRKTMTATFFLVLSECSHASDCNQLRLHGMLTMCAVHCKGGTCHMQSNSLRVRHASMYVFKTTACAVLQYC